MSSYATPADLTSLAIPASALSGISPNDQQNALDTASGVADGYLKSRFTLPLIAPYPQDLKLAVCQIAAWLLLMPRGVAPGRESQADDRYFEADQSARRWLRDVSDGRVTPAVTDSAPAGKPAAPTVISKAPRGFHSRYVGY